MRPEPTHSPPKPRFQRHSPTPWASGKRTYVSTGCTPPGVTSASLIVTMASRPGDLPGYGQPPVVEVALAIQFKSAIGFRSFDLGKVAACWSDTLPEVSERPPLGPMAVEFAGPAVAFKVSEETETPRLWLMNEPGSQLLQLQQDRLVVNWRRLPSDIPYPPLRVHPRVPGRGMEPADGCSSRPRAVPDLGRTVPEPSICEVQYVNHLDKRSGWRSVGDTPAVVAPWDGSMSDGFLPPAREAGLSLLFELPDGRGWLAVDGRSGQLAHGRRAMTLNLISRGGQPHRISPAHLTSWISPTSGSSVGSHPSPRRKHTSIWRRKP